MDFGYDYGYEFDRPAAYGGYNELLGVLITIYLVLLTAVIIVGLAGYILHSVGMYRIGQRMGKACPWLAFIPFARKYFQGELAEEISFKKRKIKNPGIWNLIIPIIADAVFGTLFGVFIVLIIAGVIVAENTGSAGLLTGGMFGMILFYLILLVLTVVYSAVYMVLKVLINMQVYERFTTRNMAVVHAVLSQVIPLYEAICYFVMRNRAFGSAGESQSETSAAVPSEETEPGSGDMQIPLAEPERTEEKETP